MSALDRRTNTDGWGMRVQVGPHPPENQGFHEAIEYFIRACPGPLVAEQGLRIAAYQRIRGIVELKDGSAARRHGLDAERKPYVRSLRAVANELPVSAGSLSASARRRGYSYSKALRWIRFLHVIAMREEGVPALQAIWWAGFSDPSGWTRFVQTLVGKGPSQLPRVPLGFWVRWAVEAVYMSEDGTDLPAEWDESDGKDK